MPLLPDPAGVFDSDSHRRVLGHLRAPDDDGGGLVKEGAAMDVQPQPFSREKSLSERLALDVPGDYDLTVILADLERDGLVSEHDGAYKMTKKGFDLLTGPIANEPEALSEAAVQAMLLAGDLTDDDVAAWRERHAA